MTVSVGDILKAFGKQAHYCRQRGADFTASIIDGAALDLELGGPFTALLDGFSEDPGKAGLALRIAGAVHYLAIKGRAGPLQQCYAAPQALEAAEIRGALAALVNSHEPVFRAYIARPPQTNEINRLAVLVPAFSEIAKVTGLPLELYEPGTSGGLLLRPDICSIDYGAFTWGGGRVQVTSEWRGAAPDLAARIEVRGRYGCDRDPIDYSDPEQLDIAHSYFWPEHSERRKSFDAAVAATRSVRARVDRADAVDWIASRDIPKPGVASVVFTSVFAVYLDDAQTSTLHRTIAAFGERASDAAPFAFVQFEPEEVLDFIRFNVDVTIWPGGVRRRIATAHAHGQWVEPAGD